MTAGGKTLTLMAKQALAEKQVKPRLKEERRPNFIRAWRKFRKLTIEQLAECVEMTPSSISQLERGLQGYSDKSLGAIAEALKCSPGDLLMRDPTVDGAIWEILNGLDQTAKKKAVKMLRAFIDDAEAA